MSDEKNRFCPDCDYQGTDLTCPVCHREMVDEEVEMDRIISEHEEEDKKDLIETDSLEELQSNEVQEDNEQTDEAENF